MIMIMFLALKMNHYIVIKEGKKYSVYIWEYYGENYLFLKSFVFKNLL